MEPSQRNAVPEEPAERQPERGTRSFRAVLDRLREKRSEVLPARIAPRPRDSAGSPLSFAQQRLWFLAQLRPDDTSYNVSATVLARGHLRPAALAGSFRQVVLRHEGLRTRFVNLEGRPLQAVDAAPRIDLPIVDLSALADPEAAAKLLARDEAGRPFDLETGPLLRTTLLRLDRERHWLLLTIHHLVSDAWSMGVLIREVTALYRAAIERGSPGAEALPPLPIQYADFAGWQLETLRSEALARALDYWRRQLAGCPPALELPTDRPRTSRPSPRGARRPLSMPGDLRARVEALARREETTPFVVLLAAFLALLHRWTGQEDLVVGTPFANRRRSEVQGLIGFFVNTLPIRVALAGRPSFAELVRRARESVLGAHAHQELPFERLVEELRPERAPGRMPLFQVVFAFQNVPLPRLALAGLDLELRRIDAGTSMFDLTLDLEEVPGGLFGWFEHSTDLFDRPTAARLAGALQRIVEAAVGDPVAPVGALDLLGDAERHQLRVEWNDTAASLPHATLHGLFREQAALRPGAVAVEDGAARWSYGELDRRANRLARHLRSLGAAVGPEVPVALCLDRSAEAVLAILAILAAGGAYVPLDPSYPAERLAWMLEDAGARIVIAAARTAGALAAHSGLTVVDLDRDAAAIAARSAAPLSEEAEPDNLAYILYTSGSTGRPKGVAVTHRNVVRLVRGGGFARFGPEETLLLLAPLSFDASTLEIWGALAHGARLAVLGSRVPSLEELGRTLERHRVTLLWLTAGLFHQLAEVAPGSLRGVRQLLAGGDVLAPQAVRRALAEGGVEVVVNGYGPTEGTTFTCCHPQRWPDEIGASVPIGRPIAATRVHVLDAEMSPVAIGVPGELYAGGAGLARGYLGRPGRTAERFVPDPFANGAGEAGARLYRTGDRARWRPDGRLEFLGRVDRQVKIRGFRVEPGEVEAALGRHPDVAEAVVLPREDRPGDRRLVAWLVPRATAGALAPLVPDDVRRFLRASLPEPLVPSAFVILPALPLTANGKVDRAALPAPERTTAPERRVPRGPVAELLAELWEEILGPERIGGRAGAIGPDDDFFALGGHSLLATRLVSRIREALDVELPLADLFHAPTLGAVADRVRALRRETGGHGSVPAVVPVPRDQPLPLSFSQERLWWLEQVEPGSPVFPMPLRARLRGPLDARALERSLQEIVARHEVLRTSYPAVDGRPVQRIAPLPLLPALVLPLVDLSSLEALAPDTAGAETARLEREEARRPFDLTAGPVLRAALLRRSPEEHDLLLTLHHITADGWSLEILARELSGLYRVLLRGDEPSLPALPVQYADFAVWQRERLRSEREPLLAWWRGRLLGAPAVLELPADRPRPEVPAFRGAVRSRSLGAGLALELEALARSAGCTLYMALLAAFEVLIHGLSGRDDFLVGSPVAGRSRGEVEGLIGFFVNMLTLRASLAGDPPFRRLLAGVRESVLGAHAHQDLPFDELVADLRPERRAGRSPLFQVVFAWQEDPEWSLELPGIAAEPLPPALTVARYDLHLAAVRYHGPDGGGLDFHLTYDADLFEESTADALLRRWEALLRAACARPDDRIDKLLARSEPGREERDMQRKISSDAQRERLLRVQKPKPSAGSRPSLVKTGPAVAGRTLPLLVEPATRDVDLAAWSAAHREQIGEWLLSHGAVLFRGFDVESIDGFREVASAVSPDLLAYEDATTPRTEVAGRVYTSTDYPPEQTIPHHNELSYNPAWPMKIFFYCVTEPADRGETPLADSRRVYEAIDPAVRERFVSHGVRYVRTFGEGVGLSWQQVFRTDSREGVEAYCRERGMTWEWRGDAGEYRLRTYHTRPAVARHPVTGETVWFNQANVHHPSSLPPALRESLLAVAADRDFPLDTNACYGDGSLIPDEDIAAVRRAYEQENVLFSWRRGDLLVADNMLVAHGRSPFSGPRRIVVLMAESRSDGGA
jgi:amino acid adenylation domain-containing protein